MWFDDIKQLGHNRGNPFKVYRSGKPAKMIREFVQSYIGLVMAAINFFCIRCKECICTLFADEFDVPF